jgi:hypothetical protein
MVHRRREKPTSSTAEAPAFDAFHEWVLSLPWVVERPCGLDTPGVRCFGVDCEPLGRRRLWLISGIRGELNTDGLGLAVIVPVAAAAKIEDLGWGRIVSPMPGGHVLVIVSRDSFACRQELEALVMAAYGYTMS